MIILPKRKYKFLGRKWKRSESGLIIIPGPNIIMRPIAAAGGGGTVNFDSATPTSNTGEGITSSTLSFNNAAGTFLVVLVGYGEGSQLSGDTCTYAGVSMTAIPGFAVYDGTWCGVEGFYLASPATGANNIVWTAGASAADMFILGAISVTGQSAGTPLGTAAVASSRANMNATVNASSATGELVVSMVTMDANTLAIGGSGASRFEAENVASDICGSGGTWTGAASVTTAWTGSGGDSGWAIASIPIKP